MNQRREYKYLAEDEKVTLANGAVYKAEEQGVYVLFDNGSVLGPFDTYDDAELAADGTVNSWLNMARTTFH